MEKLDQRCRTGKQFQKRCNNLFLYVPDRPSFFFYSCSNLNLFTIPNTTTASTSNTRGNKICFTNVNFHFCCFWRATIKNILFARWTLVWYKLVFFTGGYYTVKSVSGLRILALNTNLYYTSDKVTAGIPDPADQFRWMEHVLNNSRASSEKVYWKKNQADRMIKNSFSHNILHVY